MIEERATEDRVRLPAAAGWYAVAVLCVALLVSFTDRLAINLVVDPIRADLALSDFEVSLLQGAGFAVIFALAGVPCGRLADRVNRRNVIVAGITLWSLATIAGGLAGDFWGIFGARVFVGLGEAALIPAASSLIIDFFAARRRGVALGIFSLGATFGTGTALFVGGLVLGWSAVGLLANLPFVGGQAAWRQMFVLIGVPGLVLVPLILLIDEPVRRHRSELLPVASVLGRLLADNGLVLRVCLVKGALGIGDYALISWLPTLLQRAYHMTPLEAGGLTALAITSSGVIASVAGGALSDWVVRRWGVSTRIVLLLGCYAMTITGAAAMFVVTTGQQVALAFALWAFGSIAGYVIGHVVMQERVPNQMRATTIALSLTVTALLGIGLGPSLVPLVAQLAYGTEGGLQLAMASVSAAAALLACAIIWSPIRQELRVLRAG